MQLQLFFRNEKHIYIPSFPPFLLSFLFSFPPSSFLSLFPFIPPSFLPFLLPSFFLYFLSKKCHVFLGGWGELGKGWGGVGGGGGMLNYIFLQHENIPSFPPFLLSFLLSFPPSSFLSSFLFSILPSFLSSCLPFLCIFYQKSCHFFSCTFSEFVVGREVNYKNLFGGFCF